LTPIVEDAGKKWEIELMKMADLEADMDDFMYSVDIDPQSCATRKFTPETEDNDFEDID
jgi:hypothetical protein